MYCKRNYFEELHDREFFERFCLRKDTYLRLLADIELLIKSQTASNNALTPVTKLLLTLRFYATGSMLIVVGDFGRCQ